MQTRNHAAIIAEAKRMRQEMILGFFSRLFRARVPSARARVPSGALRHS